MKGILKGYEPIDYISKNGEPKQGCTIYFDVKSNKVFGSVGKEEYIKQNSPIYARVILPNLEKLEDEKSDIWGAELYIDYNVEKRNGMTFSSLADLTITLNKKG